MAAVKVSTAMQEQILKLHREGVAARKIAKTLKVSRNTVKKIIERGDVAKPGAIEPEWSKMIDWEKVRLEASRGVQMNILAREHAEGVVSYVQFWRRFYKKYPDVPQTTMRLQHTPGERAFFDYTDGIEIVDRETGEIKQTQLMCGVLAMSSYTFGEFTWTLRRDDLMRSMENAFRFFGGVTPYVTVDNQKAAVDRAHWYDPDVNPSFVDFANHWGFAVIPARPYRPRDKGANESGIGVVQRQFYQEVRGRTFYSLEELNSVFRIYLERLNGAVMKDWGVSRRERFDGERELLKQCPLSNWERAEWRSAKVHADCHVQIAKKFYSVPYAFVGREVRVRVTSKLVEIFDQDLNSLSSHARLEGQERYSTDNRHYPAEKLAQTQFSVQHALREAAKIGLETETLVIHLLSGSHPLKYLRRVQGILRLYTSARATRLALEHAARMAMQFNKPYLQYVQNAAEHFDRNGNRPVVVRNAPVRDQNQMYLHEPNNQSPDGLGQEIE